MARPVLLYDAECGLCNGVVRLLVRSDRSERLLFAPLQGASAQVYLRARGLPTKDFDSLVFVPDWDEPNCSAPLLRTDGALAAARVVGGVWRPVTWLRIFPAGVRDPFYRLVARLRRITVGRGKLSSPASRLSPQRFLE